MSRTSKKAVLRLTAAQRRHLEVSLGRLQSELAEARSWFAERPVPGVSPSDLVAGLEALEGRVQEVALRLGLSPADLRPDPRQKLQAWASSWWTIALDCRSKGLRGYGEVDAAAAALVDPIMEDLAGAFLALGRLASDPGPPSGSEAPQVPPAPSAS